MGSGTKSFSIDTVEVSGVEGAREYVAGWASQDRPVLWLVAEEPQSVSVPDGAVLATYLRVRRAWGLERDGYDGAMDGFRLGEEGVVVLEHLPRCVEGSREFEGLKAALVANQRAFMVAVDRTDQAAEGLIASLEDRKRYHTMAAAARAVACTPQAVKKAIKFGHRCGGRHWAKLEPGEPIPDPPASDATGKTEESTR